MFITLISHQNKCSLQRKASSFTTLQSFYFKGTKTIYASSAFFTAKDNTIINKQTDILKMKIKSK